MMQLFATRRQPLRLGLSLLILTFACAPSGEAPSSPPVSAAPTVSPDAQGDGAATVLAVVDGEEILSDRVDARIRKDLFDQTFGGSSGATKLYDARREAIQGIIREVLAQQAAAAAGQDEETWLAAAIEANGPVSDEEVAVFFEQNKSRLGPDAEIGQFEDRIRLFLSAQRSQKVYDDLYQAAEIKIEMPRQRSEVAATGPSLGPEDAPVTIIEFSDFQCPYCARVVPTIKQLTERYPEQVRIVFRHLPLSFHAQAKLAAQASVCADNQDNFWAFHDKLFENQRAMEREQLIQYATDLELDMQVFEPCLDAPETVAIVEADLDAAQALGASGTPAFFINGIMISGAQPIENFETIIQEELTQTGT